VEVRRPDVNASAAGSGLERAGGGTSHGQGGDRATGPAVRLGISYVRTIGPELAERIAAGRPYIGMEDVVRRSGLSVAQAEALATAGAFECFGLARREALWAAGAIAQAGPGHTGAAKSAQPAGRRAAGGRAGGGRAGGGHHQAARLAGLVTGTEAPPLPGMSPTELNRADLWATGLSPDSYPTELLRPQLDALGVVLAADLGRLADGAAVTIGGLVTHRQRPMTAKGVVFVNLEDETGLVNVICPLPVWERFGQVARSAPGLLVRGRLEKADGAINVLASGIEALPMLAGATNLRSRDFR
jgi:error-prone DNA polymerase